MLGAGTGMDARNGNICLPKKVVRLQMSAAAEQHRLLSIYIYYDIRLDFASRWMHTQFPA